MPERAQTVNWLFLDLNAFFASCEQQENPALRGKPIIIVQMQTDSTCAIAASYEAKAFGIKAGTWVKEAKQLCPALIPVTANHRLYTLYHERILEAVDACVPIEKVLSIDEFACRLTGRESRIPAARELALKIKGAIRERVGECLTCSIGLAPSIFLGKVASDIQKPDGLVVITKDNLPDVLLRLKLQDIYGIGPRMEARLNRAGVFTVMDLWNSSSLRLRQIWGGINGVLFHQLLHGADLQPPSSAFAHSLGHQHVLEPELRSTDGARQFAQHLLTKAAERLRHRDYYCRRLGLHLRWLGDLGSWWNETSFQETRNSGFLLNRLDELWQAVPPYKPLSVGVTLLSLVGWRSRKRPKKKQNQNSLLKAGEDPWHRDGLLFQAISWVAAHKASGAGTSVFSLPHQIPAHKGFDGLQIELDKKKKLSGLIIFEDKATDNPRNTITQQVWPELELLLWIGQLLRKRKRDLKTNWNDYLHLASNHSPKCCRA